MTTSPAPMVTDRRVAADAARHDGPWRIAWRRLRRDRVAMAAGVVVLVLAALAVLAPLAALLTGHGPNELFQREMTDDFGLPRGPNADFLLGADTSGRDVLVRAVYGAQVSLAAGVVATGVAVVIGLVLGLVAGFRGGVVDTVVSRSGDVVLALPLLVVAIGIVSACGSSREGCMAGTVKPGLPLVIVVIALFTWPYIARVVRSAVLSLRESGFVEASRASGASDLRIMRREILPNLASPVIVYASLLIPQSILFEASLSFLGLGVPDTTPSWGRMIADAADVFDVAWWLMLVPGLMLLATVLAFNLLGDGLRDALDPTVTR